MQMTEEHKNTLSPDEHTYHPLIRKAIPVTTIVLLVIFGLQTAFTVYSMIAFHVSLYPDASIARTIDLDILSLLFWLVLPGLSLIPFMKLRLVTLPQGIIFYGSGYSIYTPWSNLVGRGKMDRKSMLISPLLLRNVESLQFEPSTTPMSLEQAIEQHRPAIEETGRNTGLYRFARVDMIPIGYFLHDWQHSLLAQEIHHYAPQVFAAG